MDKQNAKNEKCMVDLLNQEMKELQAHQKQIEEMAKDVDTAGKVAGDWLLNEAKEILNRNGHFKSTEHTKTLSDIVAEELAKMGYRKIPENAVALTRKEYIKLEQKIADLSYDADFHKQQEQRIADLQYDKFELKQEISEKDNKIALLEETIECIKFNVDFTRKETAEQFAKILKNRLESIDTILHEDNEEVYLSANELGELIDEICKEITEGKENENG